MMFENADNTPSSDPVLIRRTREGDNLAAETLAGRHRKTVLATAYHALGNSDDANDVAQEVLVYAFQRLHELRDPEKLAAWLRQVTLSLCADYRRRRKTRRLGEPITVLNEATEEVDYAWRLTIRQALSAISENHRTTFLLHYVGGWSLEEVAAILAVPVNTVRSRLMAAKRLLRADLHMLVAGETPATKRKPMPVITAPHSTVTLPEHPLLLLKAAFPDAVLRSVENDIEPWQPFGPRVRIETKEKGEKTLDFRGDIDPERARLLRVLQELGVPGPRLLHGPVKTPGGYLTLCEKTRGENLTLWTLGGTPHRIRLATERAFEGIDRLQSITPALLQNPVSESLTRRTLTDEIAILTDSARWNADPWLAEEGNEREAWLQDPWFTSALAKVQAAVGDISDPLVYTDYTFFFPQNYRIQPGGAVDEEEQENPLVEFTCLFGHLGDPLLGLAMVWVYDCYPFVHTGFVEQFLWRRGVTRREFAPRLGLKALQMVARDLPVTRPDEGGGYWDSLRGWVTQALSWM